MQSASFLTRLSNFGNNKNKNNNNTDNNNNNKVFIYTWHLITFAKTNCSDLEKRYVFKVQPGGYMNIVVLEVFRCLLRVNKIRPRERKREVN